MCEQGVVCVIQTIGRLVGPPIWHEFGYFLNYDNNMENLRIEVGTLEGMSDGVQRSVDAATRSGEVIRRDVYQWLNSVTEITAEAHTFLENDFPINRCFYCWSHYRRSKEAIRKTEVVTRLQGGGGFISVINPPPPSIESMSAGDFFAFESRNLAFNEVIKALEDDNVSIIGIYGLGGVGKTTLVKEIGKQVKKDKHFDEVLTGVVSQIPNIKGIQDQISEILGLNLTETNETMRAERLSNRLNELLKEKRILVILDDIWSRLELPNIGIPLCNNNNSLKIILTTRREQVCAVMGCQKEIALNVLSVPDSWNLFRCNAGDVVDFDTLNDVPREVARECGGLPIALVTVGRALRNNGSLQKWQQAAIGLGSASPTYIEGVHEKVYASLKLSYDFLPGVEAREMFLLCCLFPEDHDIDIETLVLYGVGNRLFQGLTANTVEEARNRAYEVIQNIKDSCLLLKSDRKYHIKVHDIVRDVGKYIASANNTSLVRASVGLEKWPIWEKHELCTSISLMYNDIQEVPSGLNCPTLKILLLQGNSNLKEIPYVFFEGMESLEVLDLSNTRIATLPASLKLLRNLRTLQARNMYFNDISIFGKLKNLEILDLEYSQLVWFQTEIGELGNLRVLNLSHCALGNYSMCKFISSLSQLEELYIVGNYWWNEGKKIEWKSLSCLTILHIQTEDVGIFPEELCTRLKRFFITEASNIFMSDTRADASLYLSAKLRFGDGIKVLLEKTTDLQFWHSECWRNVLLDLDELGGGLQCLQYLQVSYCDRIKYLIHAREELSFPNLESLAISNLNSLKEICSGLLPHARCFWKLSSLTVQDCKNLLIVIPLNLLTKLLNLENLEVEECEKVEVIFDLNYEGVSFLEEDLQLLSTLTELILYDLSNLKKIWKGSTRLVCLRNLKHIYLSFCPRLRNIFLPTLAQALPQLENLEICYCEDLKEVVIGEEEVAEIVFPKLHSIQLIDLRNLICFCSGRFSFKFPALENLIVQNCYKMKTFTSGDLSTPKLKTIKLNSEDSFQTLWLEGVNETIQHLFNWVFSWREQEEEAVPLDELGNLGEGSSSGRRAKTVTVEAS